MKSEKLYDAITNRSEENITRCDNAVKKMKKPSKKLWISWVAAMLVVAIVVGVVLWPGKDSIVISANAIFEAEYPDRSDLSYRPVNNELKECLSPFFNDFIARSLTGAGDENVLVSPLSVYMACVYWQNPQAVKAESRYLMCWDMQIKRYWVFPKWSF